MRRALIAVVAIVLLCNPVASQRRVERNVVYGMYSGLALLMDVYYPETSNGYGVIVIPGSGWQAELRYGASSIKDRPAVQSVLIPPIVAAGYTAFVLSHRATPAFRYPAAVDDVQRAVRYVRHSATDYHINPARIGAWGHSSGGHLALMLGVLQGSGNPEDIDPVNRESAHVQAVVTVAAPTDLAALGNSQGAPFADLFVGAIVSDSNRYPEGSIERRLFHDASPISWVSSTSAPTLLIHGDRDPVVPISQGEAMFKALQEARVPAEFIRVPNAGHDPSTNWTGLPDIVSRWFDKYLKIPKATGR